MISALKAWLGHPLTRGLDVDDPQTTQLRQRIIQEKSFLCQIYQEWYTSIADSLPADEGPVLELGSGAGFLSDLLPELIASDIVYCQELDVVSSGLQLPFAEGTLRGIVMTDVLHHLPQPRRFFEEATRCVRPGGVMVMIEPWVTTWSRLVYTKLHHEPFRPEAEEWEFPSSGPLSGANGALPWVLFERDRMQFEQEFPAWEVQTINPMMPFRYLLSGGTSLRGLMPGWSFGAWRALENILQPWIASLAMFAKIVLRRGSS